jgi:hypothetical protein
VTRVLVVLIVAATALFVVGVAAERARGETRQAAAETHEGAEAAESGGDETVGGVNAESWPLVGLAAAGSLLLAAAVWRRPHWRAALAVTAAGMAVFAAFDVREVLHQLDESAAGLAVVAGTVAALHLAAAAVASVSARG